LLKRGERIDHVIVLHTAPPAGPIADALERVRAEFSSSYYPPDIQLHTIELKSESGSLLDVDTAKGAEVAFVAIYRAVRAEKLAGRRVHLNIAGGRKTMTVFGMAAAQMLFDEGDKLWHIVSQGKLLEEKRMHAQDGDTVNLIEIPVILWRAVSPVFTDLNQIDDPFKAVELQRSLRLSDAVDEARSFLLGVLTGAERQVTELVVEEGLTEAQLAARLTVARSTINTHLEHIYEKSKSHWQLETMNRAQLVRLLSVYYAMHGNRGNTR